FSASATTSFTGGADTSEPLRGTFTFCPIGTSSLDFGPQPVRPAARAASTAPDATHVDRREAPKFMKSCSSLFPQDNLQRLYCCPGRALRQPCAPRAASVPLRAVRTKRLVGVLAACVLVAAASTTGSGGAVPQRPLYTGVIDPFAFTAPTAPAAFARARAAGTTLVRLAI